jgi:hypothetical protein
VNCDQVRTGKDVEIIYSKVLSQHSLGEIEINSENSVRIAGIPVKIQTLYLTSKNLESYCSIVLLKFKGQSVKVKVKLSLCLSTMP